MRMATKDYVPVAMDDWYQRRRRDDEGKFFRSVADQGPRKGAGGSTRQGIYMLTADGKLLAYKNAGQAPDIMRDELKRGLREWRKLPEARRKPGAVKVPDHGKVDAYFTRTPPAGALVVKTWTRILDKDGDGWKRGTCDSPGADKATRDHLWVTAAEWKSMLPADPKKGGKAEFPKALAERILRFHLADGTRGEPPLWSREEIRRQEWSLAVDEATESAVSLKLEGSALLETKGKERGYDVRLAGRIRYDRAKKAVTAFDLVAVGDHWGEGHFTKGARPGKQPLGVAFALAKPEDTGIVPPQATKAVGYEYAGR
ncbi:MAG: hypothetical protein K2W96_04405 [Gemmataceae bacterium]|nr:hypothetical protein [Gemmataceae bacterium]